MHDNNGLTTILEGTIRELVRQEVKSALAEATPSAGPAAPGVQWMTPPQAARATGIPVKAIRNMVKEGVIQRRLRNVSREPVQAKYLVNVDEVTAAARGHTQESEVSIQEQARRILAERESRK